jgi:RNA polymerase sigma-70 factor (ECF subfamily)
MNSPRDQFEKTALPWLPEIYRTAVCLLGNRTEAEDLAQEVFLEAWKSWHRFEPGTNARAWLHKILVHRVHRFRKKLYQTTQIGNKEDETEDISVEVQVPDHLSDRQVVDALIQVPAPFREAIVLADVREFSYQEIAGMLGIPIGTVMSRLSRGRKLMRNSLEASGIGRK